MLSTILANVTFLGVGGLGDWGLGVEILGVGICGDAAPGGGRSRRLWQPEQRQGGVEGQRIPVLAAVLTSSFC